MLPIRSTYETYDHAEMNEVLRGLYDSSLRMGGSSRLSEGLAFRQDALIDPKMTVARLFIGADLANCRVPEGFDGVLVGRCRSGKYDLTLRPGRTAVIPVGGSFAVSPRA